MEIKAQSNFDLDTIKAFSRLQLFKKHEPKKRMIFWTVACSILLIIVVLEVIFLDVNPSLLYVLGGVLVVVFALECYWYFFLPKIQYNALGKMKDIENEFLFCDNAIKVCSKNEEFCGTSEIEYSALFRAFETGKYFFLWQTKTQVLIVDKSTIEGGTHEEIRNKLLAVLGKQYVICCY